MPSPDLDGAPNNDALAPLIHRLGDGPSAEGERMRGRLAAKMFGVTPTEPDRIGRFELRERIGAGAMGVVYEAWDPKLDRRVAIKLLHDGPGRRLDPDSDKRLLREAKAMARLRHPNVVQVHEIGTHGGQVFVAMELIDGVSLRAWLAERPRSWRAVVEVFGKAGRGLAAAHAAELVHRDFKPDNVLIEAGRVFVGDFGLARSQAGQPEPEAELAGDPSANTTLTRTGAFVGTPAYMAPEAFGEDPPDPRADQYSFCASLYEALYNGRPWSGETLSQLRAQKSRALESLPKPPSRAVPRWLRRAILRGLAPKPEQRFPSMDALLLELDRGLRRSRWLRRDAWLVLGVVGVATGGAWALAKGTVDKASQPDAPTLCSDSPQQLEQVWNPERKTKVLTALSSAELGSRTVAALDGYGRRWSATHQSACEATHLHGQQSARALDLRMRCLDRRRSELDALLTRFETPSSTDRLNSLVAVEALTPVESCDNVELLESTVPLPEDPRVRAKVEELRLDLDAVSAGLNTNSHAEIVTRAEALLEAATPLGYRPLTAEAEVALGTIRSRTGRPKDAKVLLEQALVDAQASGYDEFATRAVIGEIFVVGFQLSDSEGGERLLRQGRALLERIGDPPRLLANYARNAGSFELARGNLEAAKSRFEQAIALYDQLHGEAHFSVAESRSNLAVVERRLGNYDTALKLYEQAKRDYETSLGSVHPGLVSLLSNIGVVHMFLGHDAEAEASLRAALELAAQTMPENHASLGHPYNNLGELMVGQGRYAQARESYDRAIEIWTEALPPDNPLVAHPLTGRGLARLELGDAAGAREDLERAFAIRISQGGSPRLLAETEFTLARALDALGEPKAETRDLAKRALEHFGEADGDLVTRAQVRAWLERHKKNSRSP